MRGNDIISRTEFGGLTRYNQNSITERAASIAGLDPENIPETSFATAIRDLKTASDTTVAWRVPRTVAKKLPEDALAKFNRETPDGTSAYQAERPGDSTASVFIETDRFQAFYSPEVLKRWLSGDFHDGAGADVAFDDALWHVPTSDYTATNPVAIYEPLEEAIREEELGDSMFGEIRTRKMGGEVHMDILFDKFTVDFGADADPDNVPSGGPIVLGIRTGYDFFGGRAVYAEGFAQDTSCKNSIRSVTEKKTRRSVGDANDDVGEWWADILTQMDLMTDQLVEAIEAANEITLEVLEMDFAEPFDHNDDLVAFYELAGFPSYLAEASASHCESRSDDPFAPTMWDLNSGATYALTHEFNGGEDTSRMNTLSDIANDMVMNPAAMASRVERSHREAVTSESGEEQHTLAGESVHANVERFTQTLEEQREEFETRQEQLRETILTDGGEEQ